MTVKKLDQLFPDVLGALRGGLEETAKNMVQDLKAKGPYWSGQFESLWVVETGAVEIPKNIPTLDRPTPKTPRPKRLSKAFIPLPQLKKGYTIGNRASYAGYAQDLIPSPTGRRAPQFTTMEGKPVRITAPKFWFDTYLNAQAGRTVERSLTRVFRKYNR